MSVSPLQALSYGFPAISNGSAAARRMDPSSWTPRCSARGRTPCVLVAPGRYVVSDSACVLRICAAAEGASAATRSVERPEKTCPNRARSGSEGRMQDLVGLRAREPGARQGRSVECDRAELCEQRAICVDGIFLSAFRGAATPSARICRERLFAAAMHASVELCAHRLGFFAARLTIRATVRASGDARVRGLVHSCRQRISVRRNDLRASTPTAPACPSLALQRSCHAPLKR
jgi:hypothetical protein